MNREDRKFIMRKIPIKDYWIMSDANDKGMEGNHGRGYYLICPNCFSPVNGNPIKITKYNKKLNLNEVYFVRVPYQDKEYKVLCCSDKNVCKKAWMKSRDCDENGVSLNAK